MITTKTKHQRLPLRYFRWLQTYRETEKDIRDLENQFMFTDKDKHPVEWVLLQKELGEKYRKLMEFVK